MRDSKSETSEAYGRILDGGEDKISALGKENC
jgi:hypothetical protein